jgi:phospholipase/carboxylesterase
MDLISSVPHLKVPKTKFVLPTANSIPINLNGNHRMPGWSDIYGLSPDSPEDKAGLEKSRERINALLAKEVSAGIAPSRIILAGFSQGGALALHTVRADCS